MKRFIALMMVLAMSLSLFAGCAKKEETTTAAPTTAATEATTAATEAPTEAPKERVLRMDAMMNAGYPAPHTTSAKGAGYVTLQFIYDSLMWKNEDGVMPYLAKSYEVSNDSLVYTFHLNEGVKFNDGEAFTAEDVKFTFDYLAKFPYSWVSTEKVKEVRVIDDLTVEIELNEVYVPFITDIAATVPMMAKHVFENVEDPTTFTEPAAFTGTGPMMLESYDAEAGVWVFVKNPDYFYGEVQIDKLIMSQFKDPKTALLNGEIDVAATTSFKQALSMEGEENITVLQGPSLWLSRIYFNFDEPAFNEQAVREAMVYAIDREAILKKAYNSAGIAGMDGYMDPSSPYYNDKIVSRTYDEAKANELLDTVAKDTDGDGIREYKGKKMSYELLVSENDEALAELLKAYYGAAGIELTVKAADDNTVKQLIQEGNFTLCANGHGSFGGDPKYMANLATKTAGAAKITVQGGNRWKSDEYDKTMAASLSELDQTKRTELVHKLQEIIATEVPTIPLYYKNNASAFNNSVLDGFFYTPDGISNGIPYIYNKLVLVQGEWKAN